MRLVFVNVQRGQEILQTYDIAEVKHASRLVRVSVLFHFPEIFEMTIRRDVTKRRCRQCEKFEGRKGAKEYYQK